MLDVENAFPVANNFQVKNEERDFSKDKCSNKSVVPNGSVTRRLSCLSEIKADSRGNA